MAKQMLNFAYVVGDQEAGEAILVDPAYHPAELVALVEAEGMKVTGVVGTHYHFDHVGGSFRGQVHVDGIAELLATHDIPVHLQRDEVPWVERGTGVSASQLVGHEPGDTLQVGRFELTLIHTPGHTPGSQCLLVEGNLLSGDTLFLEGCGRTDLPGSDPAEMYTTLSQRLAPISDDTRLFPGHLYAPEPSAFLGDVRKENYVFAPTSAEQWLAHFGR
jgi:glyoxylase-like metal-dependent hydrolase (beta-lactamase superfamily II)